MDKEKVREYFENKVAVEQEAKKVLENYAEKAKKLNEEIKDLIDEAYDQFLETITLEFKDYIEDYFPGADIEMPGSSAMGWQKMRVEFSVQGADCELRVELPKHKVEEALRIGRIPGGKYVLQLGIQEWRSAEVMFMGENMNFVEGMLQDLKDYLER